MSIRRKPQFTPEEYLKLERTSEQKHEYLRGETFAMGGASARHVLIVGNVAGELRNQLRDRTCAVYSADLRVSVSPDGLYTYPDVIVVCGDPQFIDAELDTLTNPALIVEVLSETTKNYDRGEKFEQYRQIPSFGEYLLIAQGKVHVERYLRRYDGSWILTETNDAGTVIELVSINCTLSVTEIYARKERKGVRP
jgi:Uma2 family endonuclease